MINGIGIPADQTPKPANDNNSQSANSSSVNPPTFVTTNNSLQPTAQQFADSVIDKTTPTIDPSRSSSAGGLPSYDAPASPPPNMPSPAVNESFSNNKTDQVPEPSLEFKKGPFDEKPKEPEVEEVIEEEPVLSPSEQLKESIKVSNVIEKEDEETTQPPTQDTDQSINTTPNEVINQLAAGIHSQTEQLIKINETLQELLNTVRQNNTPVKNEPEIKPTPPNESDDPLSGYNI